MHLLVLTSGVYANVGLVIRRLRTSWLRIVDTNPMLLVLISAYGNIIWFHISDAKIYSKKISTRENHRIMCWKSFFSQTVGKLNFLCPLHSVGFSHGREMDFAVNVDDFTVNPTYIRLGNQKIIVIQRYGPFIALCPFHTITTRRTYEGRLRIQGKALAYQVTSCNWWQLNEIYTPANQTGRK